MENGLEQAKERVRAWLKRHNSNPRKLGLKAGISPNTVLRIVEQGPYEPGSDTWRKVARACGFDEQELLVLVGKEPPVPASKDPWAVIAREMAGMGYPPDFTDAWRQAAEAMRRPRSDE